MVRLQSSLGRIIYSDHRPDLNMIGYITIAKVLKVHHKTGTADLLLVQTGDQLISSEANQGYYAARIPQTFSGYDPKRRKSWGSIAPLVPGDYVLVTFLDHMKNRPIIIGRIPSPKFDENIYQPDTLDTAAVGGYNYQEILKYLTVFPCQAWFKVDGESNVEFAHGSKSFFAWFNWEKYAIDGRINPPDEDQHLELDFRHLSARDTQTGEPFEADHEIAKRPSRLLYVHRTSFSDNETTWTKVFINDDGTLRITRDNRDEKLSYIEITKNGQIKLRRQLDTPFHHEGSNYTEIKIDEDGSAKFERSIDGQTAAMGLTETGEITLSHSSGSHLVLDKDIYMETADNGSLLSDSLNKYIAKNHIVVGDEEPQNPQPYLLWVDTSS